ncbi:uncharacterized protein V1510DRAFT_402394 [Dipodascopsis tothii]|uniref:uncharacterized protein n=1 Tax=Dipodascopsis tothii TaxID=44089 RepID=UPI0034CD1224
MSASPVRLLSHAAALSLDDLSEIISDDEWAVLEPRLAAAAGAAAGSDTPSPASALAAQLPDTDAIFRIWQNINRLPFVPSMQPADFGPSQPLFISPVDQARIVRILLFAARVGGSSELYRYWQVMFRSTVKMDVIVALVSELIRSGQLVTATEFLARVCARKLGRYLDPHLRQQYRYQLALALEQALAELVAMEQSGRGRRLVLAFLGEFERLSFRLPRSTVALLGQGVAVQDYGSLRHELARLRQPVKAAEYDFLTHGLLATADGVDGWAAQEQAAAGLGPTRAHEYVMVINALVRRGDKARADEYIARLHARGAPTSTRHYNALLYRAVRFDDVDVALAIFRAMLDSACRPDAATFSILFNGYKRHGMITEALDVLATMDRAGVAIDTHFATDYLDLLSHHFGPEKVLAEFRLAFGDGVAGRLGLAAAAAGPTVQPARPPLAPTANTLGVVYKSVLARMSSVATTQHLYAAYREFVAAGGLGPVPDDAAVRALFERTLARLG